MSTDNPFKLPQFSTVFELKEAELQRKREIIFIGSCADRTTHQEYIAKHREMFMLEYSIAVQNVELDRLKELAESEERKLNIAEQCLEQDAALFDEFLKDNDKSSIEAITKPRFLP
ncbi:hypothetical protein T265_04583 [Opisthorchis viverrini]|uniref:DUF4200 domain-containing protein n=1 Tax=Opisthorchis viverrini TaxID=6198 RepID=A0A074ZNF2_OPIVI|nr:hypothetical protein T265_04583 [Opisthorchis viverrini]KER28631.1 hypothetical protein T265_04583 [Opisthorchis viverrini]